MCTTTCENAVLFVVAGVGVSLASCLCRSSLIVMLSFVGEYFCGGRTVCCMTCCSSSSPVARICW